MKGVGPKPRLVILSALSAAPWGAAEELWLHAALRGAATGGEIAASIQGWPERPEAVAKLLGAGVRVDERPRGADAAGHVEQLARTFEPALALVSMPDVASGGPWMSACRAVGLRYATVTHYTAEFEWPSDEIVFQLGDGYAAAERAFFVSEASRRWVERQLARALPNAEVVRCPFKVPYHFDAPWPSAAEGLRLACVARLDLEDKGHDILFEVLARPKWRRRALTVTLYGAGPHRRLIEAQLDFWGLGSVRLAGTTSDLEAVWRRHHGLILCSRAEGLPAVVVEAMLAGRICVVTDVGGNGELLEDGRSGFIASYPRASAVDGALERMWARRAELEAMGQAARAAAHRAIPEDPGAEFYHRLRALAERRNP